MSDRDPLPPWTALREVDVPAGLRARVRARLDGELAARGRSASRGRGERDAAPVGGARVPGGGRRWPRAVVAVAAGLAVAAVLAVVAWPGGGAGVAAPRAVEVEPGDRVELPLTHGHVSVRGPAAAVIAGERVTLAHGTLDVLGQVTVAGPTCEARIDGTAEVSVQGATLVVRKLAGAVEVTPASVACEVIELELAAAPGAASPGRTGREPRRPGDGAAPVEPVAAGEVAPTPAAEETAPAPPDEIAPAPAAGRAAAGSPDEPRRAPVAAAAPRSPAPVAVAAPPSPAPPEPLADAVAAYRAAVALEASAPADALAAWRRWLVRWPDSALAHAAEIRVLALLGRLGLDDARVEQARGFLRRHPDSPRRVDVERLLGADGEARP